VDFFEHREGHQRFTGESTLARFLYTGDSSILEINDGSEWKNKRFKSLWKTGNKHAGSEKSMGGTGLSLSGQIRSMS